MRRIVAAVVVALFATLTIHCSRDVVTREQYVSQSPQQRELIVRSMLGGERAEDAKGSRGSAYSKTPEHYRAELDRLYAGGDQRTVNEIWKELKDKP